MIVAVGTVSMVEVPRDEVVGVVPVGERFMAAAGRMLVPRVVSGAIMRRGAISGIFARYL